MINATCIFGGSFDPITTAHIDLIKNLVIRFSRVIVVPCKTSPFKNGASASTSDRLNMLRLALNGIDVELSTYELDREGTDYTYLTVNHFFEQSHELYLAIGSEMLIELSRWKNIDEISKKARLYVVQRPDFPIDKSSMAQLTATNNYEFADFTGAQGSSSEVRVSVAMDKPDMFLSPEVADYVVTHKLYTEYCYVNELYKRFNLKLKRITHSFSTALCGIKLAKRALVDVNKATTALLLHDIGKYTTKEEAETMGVKFDGRIDDMPLPIRHAEIGAEILLQILKITDNDIIEAVRWHTTGKPNMTPIEKVVYLADYIEPLRNFDRVETLRNATEKSIDDGLFAALENSVMYVGKDDLYPITEQAYEYYKEHK